jgi:hypothetical protein
MSFSTLDENPRTEPDTGAEELRAPLSSGQVWGNLLVGAGTVLGIGSLFYKPLLFATFAVIAIVVGCVSDDGGRLAKVAVPIACVCAFLGMVLAIFVTKKPVW